MNDDIKELRARIIKITPDLDKLEYRSEWWLLGTSGCHLCDDAKVLITRFQAVQPISYFDVDIAEFDEALMMAFATKIPVLLTNTKSLHYPFSVLDLQQLVNNSESY